jgi:hypothetical protein
MGSRRAIRLLLATALALAAGSAAALPTAGLSIVAVPDSVTVVHDRTTVVASPGVLGNDLNLLGASAAVLVDDVRHGDLTLRSDGGFSYRPDPAFTGTDSFRYRPNGLLTAPTTVTITVVNTAPVAVPDSYSGEAGTELRVPPPGVLANDLDIDGDVLEAELDGGISNGSLELDEDGGFVYDPGGSFVGVNTFVYRVWDGVAWSAPATVTIVIAAVPPLPTPRPTPLPTPLPTPRPTQLPTLPPLPTPAPTPAPTATPRPTVRPTPRPTATPLPTPAPTEAPDPSSPAPSPPASSPPPTTPSGNSPPPPVTGGSTGGPSGPARPGDRFTVPGTAGGPRFDGVDVGVIGIGGFEWAVPAVALSVPGILLILAVAFQGAFGLLWLPLARRRLAGLGVRPSRP